jgi:hypothetical protein
MGVALAVVLLFMHLLRAARPLEEFKLIITVMVVGGLWESVLLNGGLLAYPSSGVTNGVAPAWLFALWATFAAQFNTTYTWLRHRLVWAVLLGMFAGPLSFHAGAALGALRFVQPLPAALALAVGWGVFLPAIAMLSRRWDGVRPMGPLAGASPARG